MSSGVPSSSSIRGSAKEWSVSGCWNSFKLTFKNADVEHEYVDAHDTQSVKNCRPLIEIVCTVISVLFVLGVSNPSNAHRLKWQHYTTTPFFVVLLFVNARLLLRTREAQRRSLGCAVSPSRAIAILFIECITCITMIAILWSASDDEMSAAKVYYDVLPNAWAANPLALFHLSELLIFQVAILISRCCLRCHFPAAPI